MVHVPSTKKRKKALFIDCCGDAVYLAAALIRKVSNDNCSIRPVCDVFDPIAAIRTAI
jgi:hypothetical protein